LGAQLFKNPPALGRIEPLFLRCGDEADGRLPVPSWNNLLALSGAPNQLGQLTLGFRDGNPHVAPVLDR
jgi:hypothetical protein